MVSGSLASEIGPWLRVQVGILKQCSLDTCIKDLHCGSTRI